MTMTQWCFEVEKGYALGVSIVRTPDGVDDMVWGLAAIEAFRDFATGFLTLGASTRRFAFA